ncbi:hypothetical protein C3920_10495 [Novacetimonas pomaceti]|uniref:Uncharacterized protein n=1 Tax=Novacetimonas pomaceti TaxID=2021998 RepID=A0ABX5P0T8_9PROT|nr:hypothetical protein C3920_10495 [Novacetimonas pomaceti]
MVKLFPKSFERRCLLEKRRHPKTFIILYQQAVFRQRPLQSGVTGAKRGTPFTSCIHISSGRTQ